MNRFYIRKYTQVYYSCIVEADTYEQAEKLAQSIDLNEMFCQETCAEMGEISALYSDELHDIPLFNKDGVKL